MQEADSAYMRKIGLPEVIDVVLQRLLKNKPYGQIELWEEIMASCRDELRKLQKKPPMVLKEAEDVVRNVANGRGTTDDLLDVYKRTSPTAFTVAVYNSMQHKRLQDGRRRRSISSLSLASSTDAEIYDFLTTEIHRHIRVDDVHFFLQDHDSEVLYDPRSPENRSRRGVITAAASSKQTVYDTPNQGTGRLLTACPVLSEQDSVLAVVVLERVQAFDSFEKVKLQEFAVIASEILVVHQLKQQCEASSNQVTVLLDVAHRLSSELEVNSLTRTIMAVSRDLLQADRSTLFLVDNERNE
eukprot:gene12396-19170_t